MAPALDPSQQRVAAWDRGALRVLAGPGTGKTTTLVESVIARIAQGAPPASILVLTFGRDAAAEIRQRLAARAGSGEPPRVATFHSLALDLALRAQTDGPPLRIMTGAEQERAVREVIDSTLADPTLRGAVHWPESIRDAVPTRGFAKEVRAAFAASRALGLTGEEVAQFGRVVGDDAWTATGPLLDAYLETQAGDQALDYAECMYRAVAVANDPDQRHLLGHVRHIYVDEYQDTDAMQVSLLRAFREHIVGLHSVVVFGDPDQAIYGFRGADPTGIRDFAEHFPGAATEVLEQTRRFGVAIRDYAVGLHHGLVPAGFTADDIARHRSLQCVSDGDGLVDVAAYDDAGSEAAHIASRIRAMAEDGQRPWGDFAVLARNAAVLQPIERALRIAGVPVDSDVRDVALIDHHAVRVLVMALEVVAGHALQVDPHRVRELLTSPLADIDASDLRGLARAVRATQEQPVTGDEALAAALVDPSSTLAVDPSLPGLERFEALRTLLLRAHEAVQRGATPHEVLWMLWSATAWSERLREQALHGGASHAHRDLDAVCELFDVADRSVQRRLGRAGVAAFLYELRAQEVSSETLAERGYRGPAVRLLTAHRAKGLEWSVVFVAGVTEGVWPDLRRRAALLDPDRLERDRLAMPRTRRMLLDEERRLLYVACTRARDELLVSGIAGIDEDAPQCSRLIESGLVKPRIVGGRPTRIDSTAALVASLRRAATEAGTPDVVREGALARLAQLAALVDDEGRAIFPEAHPDRWWGSLPITENALPMHPEGDPLYVRGSSIDRLRECALSWAFEQRARAEVQRSTALGFGSALHAIADGVARGALPADREVLGQRLREVWHAIGYESQWQSERDFAEAERAIDRLLRWYETRGSVEVHTEVAFNKVVSVPTEHGVEQLRLRGTIDRLEVGADEIAQVFDFKTGRSALTNAKVADHGQLAFYQYAIEADAVEAEALHGLTTGGASLVHLRIDEGARSTLPKVQVQPALHDHREAWERDVLAPLLTTVRRERFVATRGDACQYCSFTIACPLQPEGRVENA